MAESGVSKNNATNENPSAYTFTGNKLFSMKLFSSWDGEKSAPNCIPRLCTFSITRLIIKKPLEIEPTSVIIAIKMRGSKRVLRSNEIAVQKNGLVDSGLDLIFSLQYPHHLKRDGNRLQILLQRRKKYKNRTILGFKTLAAGYVNMSQVLQHPLDQELNLHSPLKDGRSEAVAKVVIMSLSSQPVDQDDIRGHHVHNKDHYANYDTWDDEENQDDGDLSSNDGLSDFEAMDENSHPVRQRNKTSFGNAFASQQKNLKQKFIKLIRKFKVSDEVLESAVQEISGHDPGQFVDDYLFDDVESLSDSNPDVDAISLQSVPKPKLRPFFDANQPVSAVEAVTSKHLDTSQPIANEGPAPLTTSGKKQDNKSDKKSGEKNISDLFSKKFSEKSNAESSGKKQNEKNVDSSTTGIIGSDKKSSEKSAILSGSKKNEKSISSEASKKFAEFKLLGDVMMSSQKKFDKSSGVIIAPPENVGGVGRKADKPAYYELKHNESDSFQMKLFQDQLSALTSSDQVLPDCIIFMNYQEPCCLSLKQKLDDKKIFCVCTSTHADVKSTLNTVINRVQKYMNTSSLAIKLVILGSEGYVHSIVRPFVKIISSRSPDIINHVRFLLVPLGSSFLSQNLAQFDGTYAKLFNDAYWKELTVDKIEAEPDLTEVTDRLLTYIKDATYLVLLPFSEVVLTNKDKGPDDSSQMVVPFLGEIKLKPVDMGSDVDDGTMSTSPPQPTILDKIKEVTSHSSQGQSNAIQQSNVISVVNVVVPSAAAATTSNTTTATFVPQTLTTTTTAITTTATAATSSATAIKTEGLAATTTTTATTAQTTSSSTTTTTATTTTSTLTTTLSSSMPVDDMELQMDYWMLPKQPDSSTGAEKILKKDSKDSKVSLKMAFKSVQIFRPNLVSVSNQQQVQQQQQPLQQQQHHHQHHQQQQQQQFHESSPSSGNVTSGLSMVFVTKDKKQKIMRIGKKSRDDGLKSQQVDGISRLICTTKSQNQHLTVNIDGVDWTGIKFFQVSTHWQSHCKHLPVLIFSATNNGNHPNN